MAKARKGRTLLAASVGVVAVSFVTACEKRRPVGNLMAPPPPSAVHPVGNLMAPPEPIPSTTIGPPAPDAAATDVADAGKTDAQPRDRR